MVEPVPEWVLDIPEDMREKVWNDSALSENRTPPTVGDCTRMITNGSTSRPFTITFEQMQDYAGAHILFVCKALKSDLHGEASQHAFRSDIPEYVSRTYLEDLVTQMAIVQRALHAPSVTVVLLEN